MPMVWSARQVEAGLEKWLSEAYENQHLPACSSKHLPIKECHWCGGPERYILIEAMAEAEALAVSANNLK